MARFLSILVLTSILLIVMKFISGSSSRADHNTSTPHAITVSSEPLDQLSPVAGIPRDRAQAIVDRQRSKLMNVPGVYDVSLGDEGVLVGVIIHTQDQTKKPPLPSEIQALPSAIENLPLKVHPLYILPPPPGVLVSQPGGKYEEMTSCPEDNKEFVKFGWRFCFDPGHPDTIPTQLMVPPIKGIPFKNALEILERNRTELEKLPGVESVGMGDEGISVYTDNPGIVPSAIEGLPIKTSPSLGPGQGASHTETLPPVRPLHGGTAGRGSSPNSSLAFRNTITGIVLSDGKPWAVFPTHTLPGCITFPPCSFNPPSASLNTCQHNMVVQGTQFLGQPALVTPSPLVGFAQMWDPNRAASTSTDVAAAFMDNDSSEGNGSLSADRKQELWTEIRGSSFTFTGLEVNPVVNEIVYVVTENLPHVMQAVITNINQTSVPLGLECAAGTFYFSNQMYLTGQIQFSVGDSGSIVLDGAGSVMGMFNWQLNADRRKGGGTQASTIRNKLHFDAWYGTSTVKDNTIGVFRPSTAQWFIDNGNGKYDGCTSAVPTSTRDQCLYYGISTDVPVTGDWDNATANNIPTNDFTIGIYRTATDPNQFYLDNSNSPPSTNPINFFTGPASFGYKPVAGKWQGANNATKVGVFRPSTGGWYLDNGNNVVQACGTDYCFSLAAGMYQSGDIPIAGDWNGDGIVSIGLFRPGGPTGQDYFFLSNVNPFDVRNNMTISSWNHGTVPAGPGSFGYLPLVGHWTGMARSGVGVFKSGSGGGAWYLDNNSLLFSGCSEDQCPQAFGTTGDKPLAFGKSIVKAN